MYISHENLQRQQRADTLITMKCIKFPLAIPIQIEQKLHRGARPWHLIWICQ